MLLIRYYFYVCQNKLFSNDKSGMNNRDKSFKWSENLSVAEEINIFQDYAEMIKIVARNLMQEEIERKCGEKYSREKLEEGRYSHWGYNPNKTKVA